MSLNLSKEMREKEVFESIEKWRPINNNKDPTAVYSDVDLWQYAILQHALVVS